MQCVIYSLPCWLGNLPTYNTYDTQHTLQYVLNWHKLSLCPCQNRPTTAAQRVGVSILHERCLLLLNVFMQKNVPMEYREKYRE